MNLLAENSLRYARLFASAAQDSAELPFCASDLFVHHVPPMTICAKAYKVSICGIAYKIEIDATAYKNVIYAIASKVGYKAECVGDEDRHDIKPPDPTGRLIRAKRFQAIRQRATRR